MGDPNQKKIAIAVFGLGKIAFAQHIPVIQANDDFEMVATISQSKSISGIPSFSTLKELKESSLEVDAVALCMPPHPRYDIAIEAIGFGYDILLEKPPCLTVAQCQSLRDVAEKAGVTIFASWHSKFAPMVQAAREWIKANGCDRFQIIWKESVLKWHPGQTWVSEKDGFGVIDPGINALSILSVLIDGDFSFKKVRFFRPSNWETPIAASFQIGTASDAVGDVDFDWRSETAEAWEIHIFASLSKMVLFNGGHSMHVDDVPVATQSQQRSEYTALYRHFSQLIKRKKSDFDIMPLQSVEGLYKKASWQEVEAFNIA